MLAGCTCQQLKILREWGYILRLYLISRLSLCQLYLNVATSKVKMAAMTLRRSSLVFISIFSRHSQEWPNWGGVVVQYKRELFLNFEKGWRRELPSPLAKTLIPTTTLKILYWKNPPKYSTVFFYYNVNVFVCILRRIVIWVWSRIFVILACF